MEKAVFRVGVKTYSPMTNPCSIKTLSPSDSCLLPGYSSETLGHLLTQAGFNFELSYGENYTWGSLINGSWTGLLGEGSTNILRRLIIFIL